MKSMLYSFHFILPPFVFSVVAHPALKYCEANDVYAAAHVELTHGVGLVRLDCLDAQV